MQSIKLLAIALLFSINVFAENPPNFILILTDDQAWSGSSVRMDNRISNSYGDGYITPAMKRLAREGMRFSAGYAAGPVCVPSRYSIQLGQSVARHGMTSVFKRNLPFDYDTPDTLAELLKRYNPLYKTAHIGKWHIQTDPSNFGFDVSDGLTGNVEGGDDNKTSYTVRYDKDPKRTVTLKKRAEDFLKEQAKLNQPFFLQISHYANHVWIEADPEDVKKYELIPEDKRLRPAAYSAMTEALDRSINGVLNSLDELGLSKNTYVIFTSDNGAVPCFPPKPNSKDNINKPLRGGKWSLLEGGIRVPFIVKGPNIKPNSQCNGPVVGTDLLPTILELAGQKKLTTSQPIDGISFTSLLFNGNNAIDIDTFYNRSLTWHFPRFNQWNMAHAESAIRKNGWKLIYSWETKQRRLYYVLADYMEKFNVASIEEEKADELQEELFEYLQSVGQSVPPNKNDPSNK